MPVGLAALTLVNTVRHLALAVDGLQHGNLSATQENAGLRNARRNSLLVLQEEETECQLVAKSSVLTLFLSRVKRWTLTSPWRVPFLIPSMMSSFFESFTCCRCCGGGKLRDTSPQRRHSNLAPDRKMEFR